MKITILDRYILKSFMGPFLIIFFVVLFVLSMQVLWLYSDDIIGKGIPGLKIAEMMTYLCVTMVPMALPLGILIASIMTFGNLSEHYELIAMKAAGMSLYRIMRPLLFLVMGIGIGVFFFSNKVIPYASFKFENILVNIINQKPAMKLTPGVFDRSLGNLSLRVGKKITYDDYDYIEDVMIYDFRDWAGNTKVTTAKHGTLQTSEDKLFLIVTLYDGYSYEEINATNKKERARQQMNKSRFDKQVMAMDISSFSADNLQRSDRKGSYSMLDIRQLSDTLKVMRDELKENMAARAQEVLNYQNTAYVEMDKIEAVPDSLIPTRDISEYLADKKGFAAVVQKAADNVRFSREFLNTYVKSVKDQASWINRYGLAIHYKFSLAFSTLLLFFIGAPLGALIRKGGIGLPIVVAIVIYVIYHILSMTSERMGIEGSLDVFTARWIPTYILLPFGLWMIYRASKDMPIITLSPRVHGWIDSAVTPIKKLIMKIIKKKQTGR